MRPMKFFGSVGVALFAGAYLSACGGQAGSSRAPGAKSQHVKQQKTGAPRRGRMWRRDEQRHIRESEKRDLSKRKGIKPTGLPPYLR